MKFPHSKREHDQWDQHCKGAWIIQLLGTCLLSILLYAKHHAPFCGDTNATSSPILPQTIQPGHHILFSNLLGASAKLSCTGGQYQQPNLSL